MKTISTFVLCLVVSFNFIGAQNNPDVTPHLLNIPIQMKTLEICSAPYFQYTADSTLLVETMPEFPGGEKEMFKYLAKRIRHPKNAAKKGIEGRVIVRFAVGLDGHTTDIEIMQSPDKEFDDQIIKLISSMPQWTPGTLNGKPVKVPYILPIDFSIHLNKYDK